MKLIQILVRVFGGFLLLIVFGCASNFATSPASQTHISAIIEPLPSANGISLSYQFDQPVDNFSFQHKARGIRKIAWTVQTPNVELIDDAVRSLSGPLNQIAFSIRPENQWFDGDPGLVVLGNGVVFDMDYILVDENSFSTSIFVNAPEATLISNSLDVALSSEPHEIVNPKGFAYLGDSNLVERNLSTIVAAREFEAPLVSLLDSLLVDITNYYANLLSREITHQPKIFLFIEEDQPLGFKGFVNGNIAAIHLQGKPWLEHNDRALNQLANYIQHEAFHMVGGRLENDVDSRQRSVWLTEGAAEYFSRKLNSEGSIDYSVSIQTLFDRCLALIASQPLTKMELPTEARIPPICGEFLVSIVPLLLDDPESLTSIWSEMLKPGSRHGTKLSVSEFYEVVERRGDKRYEGIAALLLNTPGLARWQKIAEALNDVGVEISVTREQLTTAEGTRLIHKLLAQHCRGPRAFRTEGSVLIMITPDCSGGFHDEARVIEIESHPLANVAAWVEQFTLRCSRNESVRFLLQDGSEISPQCSY